MSGPHGVDNTPSPLPAAKAVKAGSEQTGFRQAHLQDGAALCRFLYEMKSRPEAYTELPAAALLHRYRRNRWIFWRTASRLSPLMVPTLPWSTTPRTGDGRAAEGAGTAAGGQRRTLRPGTTDVTRTIALGPITDEERRRSTQVRRGPHTAGHGTIPPGVMGKIWSTGRGPLWREGLDYDHGTGHGVGCVLRYTRRRPPSAGALRRGWHTRHWRRAWSSPMSRDTTPPDASAYGTRTCCWCSRRRRRAFCALRR